MPINYGRLQKWSKLVRERGGNKCALCGSEPDGTYWKRIEAHHICTKEEREDLMYDIRNGIPLCRRCHSNIHGGLFFVGIDAYQGREETIKQNYQKQKAKLIKCMEGHGWTYPADPPLVVVATK